ncbi:glycerol dehydrogenase [Gallicola sp. Sow4_E12]|uniref:glycerol dehydrogenase n=1 Tax=Gallicola sp. Sow4_E12 TaxID=3438785 RepID=UPI003F9333A1
MTKIITAPGKYVQGPGEIKKLKEYTDAYGDKTVYAIVDKFIFENHVDDINSSYDGKEQLMLMEFGGECSQAEIDKHVENIKKEDVSAVLGIGGGKSLDTAKAVAYEMGLPVVVMPTAASTDAPCSALSVIYTPEGQFEKYLFLNSNPEAVIMDEEIIVNAPARLFIAGIGDALATYFEADATRKSNSDTIAGGKQTKAGMALAKLCFDTLLEDGVKAAAAIKNQSMTPAVSNIIEANTLLSGIGFESGGLAGAHAIHNGMTALEELHGLYHGEKVAFGTLTQMVLENRTEEEIMEVIYFCQEIGLPTTFEELGIPNVAKGDLMEVAKLANDKDDTMGNMPFEVSDSDIVGAMFVVNELAQID